MPGDTDISDAAVRKATGQGWDAWLLELDAFGTDLDHTARARRLGETHPDLSGWWVQMISVEHERRRGLRVVGQSTAGGFQVACSKTLPLDPKTAHAALLASDFLPGADWSEGAASETAGGRLEVRRNDPGRMIRWFWWDDEGKSTVEVSFVSAARGTTVRFRHHGLASLEAREAYRERWRGVLALLPAGRGG